MEHCSHSDAAIPAAYGPYSHSVIAGNFVFLAGQTADFDAMNEVYGATFHAPYPVRSTVEARMPFGALVGIEATAFHG